VRLATARSDLTRTNTREVLHTLKASSHVPLEAYPVSVRVNALGANGLRSGQRGGAGATAHIKDVCPATQTQSLDGPPTIPLREDVLCAYESMRRQFADTSTYERSSAATDGHPSSFRVRSTSARRISSARATPASPAAARP
jgi:hypothetical protein